MVGSNRVWRAKGWAAYMEREPNLSNRNLRRWRDRKHKAQSEERRDQKKRERIRYLTRMLCRQLKGEPNGEQSYLESDGEEVGA